MFIALWKPSDISVPLGIECSLFILSFNLEVAQ